MHKTATLLLFMGLSIFSYAQKLPSFGKIDKADLEYKECTYQKDAAAEYLIDFAEVSYIVTTSDFVNETKFRVRIKVLKEDGIELANVRIPYYGSGNRQEVNRIDGVTFNLDEKGNIVKTELDKKSVMEQKIYGGTDMKVFTLPNVKVGSVFEYTFYRVKKNYFNIEDWQFQRSKYPVRHSEYSATVHPLLRYSIKMKTTLPVKKLDEGINGSTRTYIMNNIPGLEEEPYMSCADDYLQQIDFQLSAIDDRPILTTWESISNMLKEDEDFGEQLKKNVFKNTTLETDLKDKKTEYEKLITIWNYVKKNVAWNGNEGIYCRTGLKSLIEKHSGSTPEINLLFINLLRSADIKANPLLVSTRSNGKVNRFFPFLDQFNNVYAHVVADNKVYIIDASNEYNSINIPPWDIQFTNAFLISKDYSEFIFVYDQIHKYRLQTLTSASIDENGKIQGEASVYTYDYAKSKRLHSLKKGKEEYLKNYFTTAEPAFTFDSLVVQNDQADSIPMQSSVRFNGQLNNSGEYYFYTPNFLIEHSKNKFIADDRYTDIEFGYLQNFSINATIRFPSNLVPEELPKNMKMIMPDTSIILQRIIQKEDNLIMCRITVEIKRPTYFYDEYTLFKEFYDRFFEILNEQIVFKKKVTPKP